jgi:beta-glucosidase
VDAWIDNVNVIAVVFSHLPGQDSGKASVQVMYGKQGFSGRLPNTVGKSEKDYGDLLSPSQPGPFRSSTNMYPQSKLSPF